MVRRKVSMPIKMSFSQFLISKIRELDACNEVTLGILENGIWQESLKGEGWNTILLGKVSVPNPNFITKASLEREFAFDNEQLDNRIGVVLGVC
jgi:hypothetical protein